MGWTGGIIKKHGYTVVDAEAITDEDVLRIVELYNALYLQKYSLCNPMFNEHFIKLALLQKNLHLVAIKKGRQIDAILGYFCCNGVMTTPLFGYDRKGLEPTASRWVLTQAVRRRGFNPKKVEHTIRCYFSSYDLTLLDISMLQI